MLRKAFVLLGRLAIGASAIILPLAAFYGFDAWPGEIINSLRPQIAIGLLFFAAALLALRTYVTAGLLLIVALTAFFTAIPLGERQPTPPQEAGMTVIWANVWKKPSSLEETIALARQHDADVIALTEFPWGILGSTKARLATDFPYTAQSDTWGLGGVVVFSKFAISEEQVFGGERRCGLAMTLDVEGAPMKLVAIHPPIPATAEMTKSRNEILSNGFSILERGERGIYVGDFNTVSWSRALWLPAKAVSAKDLGSNDRSTWLSRRPVFGLPLDHAFYRGPEAAEMDVGPAIGSDHYPLIVRIGAIVDGAPQP